MARKRFSAEEIIQKLREAEVQLSQGDTIPEACRKIGVPIRRTIAGGKSMAVFAPIRQCV